MKEVAVIQVLGIRPVPWSVPDIGNTTTKSGRRVRFARRAKKSKLHLGVASLKDWQDAIRSAAARAMETTPRQNGALMLTFIFFRETPPGHRHGDVWFRGLHWSDSQNRYTKTGGNQEPDLTNLVKGAEDALKNLVFEDDVQVRWLAASAQYGVADGVRITVFALEPDDVSTGQGDPVPPLPPKPRKPRRNARSRMEWGNDDTPSCPSSGTTSNSSTKRS